MSSYKTLPKLTPLSLALLPLFCAPANAAERDLDPIVVTATRQESRTSELLSDVTVIEREQIARSGAVSLPELLARQPGVEFASNGGPGATANVYLRGGASEKHTVVLVDGMRVGSASSGAFTWPSMPLAQIERVEILRGPASALYGSDAMGGVIQIFTRRGTTPFVANASMALGNYDTAEHSAGFSGQQGGFSYSLQTSMVSTQGINNQIDTRNSSYNGDNDGYNNRAVSTNLVYQINREHELGLSYFQSASNSQFDRKQTANPATGVPGYAATTDVWTAGNVQNLRLFSRDRWTENWASTLSLGQSMDDSVGMYNGVTDNSSRYRTDQQLFSWQNDIQTQAGTFLVATDRTVQRLTTNTAYTQTERTLDALVLGWTQAWAAHRWQANVRRDENSQFKGKNTGSLAYGYQLSDPWKVRASLGTAFRAPSFNDLYYPSRTASGITSFGNPNLEPETSINREVGLTYQRPGHKFDLVWFNSNITNLIQWQTVGTNSSPVNVGSARVSGESLSYQTDWAGLDISFSLTHQDARNLDTDTFLPRRARDFATLALGQQSAKWSWQAEIFGTDRRYSDDTNKQELAGYSLANFNVAYRFQPEWETFFRLNNAFDRTYYTAGSYSATPTSNTTYAALGMNFLIGLRYSPQ